MKRLSKLFGKKGRLRASVTASSLVAIVLLFILAVALIQMAGLLIMDAEWDREKTRARWFLEGRSQIFLDALLTGQARLVPARLELRAPADGREQAYRVELSRDISGFSWQMKLDVLWKDRYPAGQKTVFSLIDPFRYALLYNGPAVWPARGRGKIQGDVGLKTGFHAADRTTGGIYLRRRSVVETGGGGSVSAAGSFTNDLEKYSALLDAPAPPEKMSTEGPAVINNPLLSDLEFPSSDAVGSAYSHFEDPSWIIRNTAFFPRKTIVNPLDPGKDLIGTGNGVAFRFASGGKRTRTLFVRALSAGNEMGPEFAANLGNVLMTGMYSGGGQIELPAVSAPAPVNLPDGAFDDLRSIALSGPGWSCISADETVSEVYLQEVSPYRKLREGRDFTYDRKSKIIRILSETYLREQGVLVGRGNGQKKFFSAGDPGMASSSRVLIFTGGQRNASANWSGGEISFPSPPAAGTDIVALKIPRVFLRKAPPSRGMGVYADRNDECAVLDLSKIRNVPRWGVIKSDVPLVVRGRAARPLVILSRSNIYLQDINHPAGGSPVLVWSGKGVWVFQDDESDGTVLNGCLIQSPLDGLFVVRDGARTPLPVRLVGSAVFTFGRPVPVAADDQPDMEIVRAAAVSDWTRLEPLSSFPLPFVLKEIRRD